MCGGSVDAYAPVCPHCGEAISPGPQLPRQIDAGEVISKSWRLFQDHMGICIGVVALAVVITLVVSIPYSAADSMARNQQVDAETRQIALIAYFPLRFAAWLVEQYLALGLAIFFLKLVRGQRAEVGDLFSGGPFYWRMLINTFLFQLVVGVGLVLCIVPGILLALMFWPYVYLLVDRNLPGIEPFTSAKDITSGNWGSVFLVGLASFGINLLGLLALCVGLIFTIPLTALFLPVAYLMITGQPTIVDGPPRYAGYPSYPTPGPFPPPSSPPPPPVDPERY